MEIRTGEVRARDAPEDDLPSAKRARTIGGSSSSSSLQQERGNARTAEDRVPGSLVRGRYGIKNTVLRQWAAAGKLVRTKVHNEYFYNHVDLMRVAGWESDEALQPEQYWLPEDSWPLMAGMHWRGNVNLATALLRRKLRDAQCFARAIRIGGVRPITAETIRKTYDIMPETLDRWCLSGRLVSVGNHRATRGYDPRAIKYYANLAPTDAEREACMTREEDRITSRRNSDRGGGIAADVLSIPELVVCVMEQVDSGVTLQKMRLVNRQWATLARHYAGARLWKPWTCAVCATVETSAKHWKGVELITCEMCTDETYLCDNCAGICSTYTPGGPHWADCGQRIDRCPACAEEHAGSPTASDEDDEDDDG